MQIQESTKCWRLSQQLDKAITTVFKPVSNHNFNVRNREEESGPMPWPPVRQVHSCTLLVFHLIVFQIAYEKKKKSEGKMVRAERQAVLDMLFSAFEKHQHYNIKELVDITKQPVVSSMHAHTSTDTRERRDTRERTKKKRENHTCPPCPGKCEQFAHRLTIAPSFVAEKIVPACLRAHADMMNR